MGEQNAMNAAEITDKLGLHSLRQRKWVWHCPLPVHYIAALTVCSSTSNRPALHLETASTKALSGSVTPSAIWAMPRIRHFTKYRERQRPSQHPRGWLG